MAAKTPKYSNANKLDPKDLREIKRLTARISVAKAQIALNRDFIRESISDLKEILFRDGEEIAEGAEYAETLLEEAVDKLSELL